MVGLIVGAAVMGIIIVVMEKGEFPGWGQMILCVLGAAIPAFLVNLALPPNLFIVGDLVGAISGGFVISLVTGMGLQRACIASAIYFVIQVALGYLFLLIFR